MQVELNVNDKQAEFFLNLLKSFRENSVIESFEIVKEIDLENFNNEDLEISKLSNKTFEKIWDNEEDSIYDKFIK